ncbi:MAG: hypothetical protein ACXW4I_11410, partial [Candidatus Deferrimicrobiaceae bacterium]
TITWRDNPSSTADDRIGFRVSTHAMYNNFEQIDYMFDRLVAAVDATGLPQRMAGNSFFRWGATQSIRAHRT